MGCTIMVPSTAIPQKIDTHTPEVLGNCKAKNVALQIVTANYFIFCLQCNAMRF